MIAALAIVAGVACVEVPDTIRAQFAGPGPEDRTNYRPGKHGAEPPPVAKASTTTTTAADADAADAGAADAMAMDAETATATETEADAEGGAP